MRKVAGESYKALSGVSRATPLALFNVGGWYANAARGETSPTIIAGLIRLTFFHTG